MVLGTPLSTHHDFLFSMLFVALCCFFLTCLCFASIAALQGVMSPVADPCHTCRSTGNVFVVPAGLQGTLSGPSRPSY